MRVLNPIIHRHRKLSFSLWGKCNIENPPKKTPLAFSVKSIPCGMGEIRLCRMKYFATRNVKYFAFAKYEGSFLPKAKSIKSIKSIYPIIFNGNFRAKRGNSPKLCTLHFALCTLHSARLPKASACTLHFLRLVSQAQIAKSKITASGGNYDALDNCRHTFRIFCGADLNSCQMRH